MQNILRLSADQGVVDRGSSCFRSVNERSWVKTGRLMSLCFKLRCYSIRKFAIHLMSPPIYVSVAGLVSIDKLTGFTPYHLQVYY